MSATTIREIEAEPTNNYAEAIKGFDVERYTQAPLRMQGEFYFNVQPTVLFERMTEPDFIAQWFGMVTGGKTDHSNSISQGEWGDGSKRFCFTPMGTLNETMLYWRAPYISAYNVKSWSMPVKDHCAVMIFEPQANGRCKLTWLQYFNDKGLVMKKVMPKMMIKMMNEGLDTLRKEYGGAGGKMQIAR